MINQFLSIAPTENQAAAANTAANAPAIIPLEPVATAVPPTTTTATTPEIFDAQGSFNAIGRKQLALKILGLKVASYLKWNLEVFERNLALQKQLQLLGDLCTVTSGTFITLPISMAHECEIGPDGNKRAFNFALTLYHRWVLRAQVLKELPARAIKPGFGHMYVD